MISMINRNPILVLSAEKPGIGALSKGRKNFAIDSGIVGRLDNILPTPNTSALFEKSAIDFERNTCQLIPGIK